MAVQLQVRNIHSVYPKYREWHCDGETKRNQPTKFMKETASEYRRFHKDFEVRFVYDRSDFVE